MVAKAEKDKAGRGWEPDRLFLFDLLVTTIGDPAQRTG